MTKAKPPAKTKDTPPLSSCSTSNAVIDRRFCGGLLAFALICIATIGPASWVYYKRQQAETHRAAKETLDAVADLKVDQIADWMKNQYNNANIIFKTRVILDEIHQFFIEPDDIDNSKGLLEWITTFQQDYGYSSVILFDAHGVARLAVPEDTTVLQDFHLNKHMQTALYARDIVFTDLHHCKSNQLIHISFFIPVNINSQTGQPAEGVLLLSIDPHRFLYPLIQRWPTSSPTAETLLVRREGNEVIFLNDLRHRPNTALALQFPISDTNRPVVKAIQRKEGVATGLDYRGIPVLAALRKIPGTPWFMVAKVDQEEIYGPLRKETWAIGAIIALLLLAAMLSIGLLWRKQKLKFFQCELVRRKQMEKTLRQNEATIQNKLKAIIEPDGDIGALELADIIDCDTLQSIMEEFYQLTGIVGAVLDLSGKVLVAVGWQDICTKFHRAHPEACRNCLESDTCLTQGVAPGSFKEYHCKNHMWDMATPLIVGGHHVGNVFIGQFFYADEVLDIELFRKQARKYGFNEAEYLAALEKVPRFSREKINVGMRFYSKLAEIFSSLSFSAIQQSRLLAERKQTEKTLIESEEKLRLIIDTSPMGICTVDPLGNFVMTNTAYEQMLGYSKVELSTLSFFDITHPEDRPENKKIFQNIFSLKSTSFFIEKRYIRKDGSIIDVAVNATGIMNADGQAILGTAFVNNITERKQAEKELSKSRKLLRDVVDASPDLMWLKDDKGVYMLCNKRFEEFFGAEKESIVGRTDYDFMPKDIADYFIENDRRAIEKGGPSMNEEELTFLSDGHVEQTETIKTPIQKDDGSLLGILGIGRDITARKQAEKDLAQHQATLESEVLERTKELRQVVNIMAGRENRMADLKLIIKNLCTRLKDAGITVEDSISKEYSTISDIE